MPSYVDRDTDFAGLTGHRVSFVAVVLAAFACADVASLIAMLLSQ